MQQQPKQTRADYGRPRQTEPLWYLMCYKHLWCSLLIVAFICCCFCAAYKHCVRRTWCARSRPSPGSPGTRRFWTPWSAPTSTLFCTAWSRGGTGTPPSATRRTASPSSPRPRSPRRMPARGTYFSFSYLCQCWQWDRLSLRYVATLSVLAYLMLFTPVPFLDFMLF